MIVNHHQTKVAFTTLTVQPTPQRPLAETATLRSFNRYKNPLLQC